MSISFANVKFTVNVSFYYVMLTLAHTSMSNFLGLYCGWIWQTDRQTDRQQYYYIDSASRWILHQWYLLILTPSSQLQTIWGSRSYLGGPELKISTSQVSGPTLIKSHQKLFHNIQIKFPLGGRNGQYCSTKHHQNILCKMQLCM